MQNVDRDGHVNEVCVKLRLPTADSSRRTISIKYSVIGDDGLKRIVCKTMFLSILSMKSDDIITELLKNKRQSFEIPFLRQVISVGNTHRNIS